MGKQTPSRYSDKTQQYRLTINTRESTNRCNPFDENINPETPNGTTLIPQNRFVRDIPYTLPPQINLSLNVTRQTTIPKGTPSKATNSNPNTKK